MALYRVTTVTESMILARGLRKSFGDFEAVKGIDVDVRRGEAFGFLGPNGAGKSSTMRMIASVSPISGGELTILGMDPATHGPTIRGRLGVCPQEDTLDNELNVRDNLFIYGRYFGIPRGEVNSRVDELLEFVQLTEKAKSRVEDLSGGMKRRLTIARSLVNRPDLLLLDEPTTGLDPQARHVLWDQLFRLKQAGVTLVITTHYMDEAEQLCDRLVVMDKGLIAAEGSPRQLIEELESPAWAIGVLLVAVVLEGFSLRTAVKETGRGEVAAGELLAASSARPVPPELPVVLLEDTAALTGLVLALLGCRAGRDGRATVCTTASAPSPSASCCSSWR